MKLSFIATCAAFAASASALPTSHYANVAPIAFGNEQIDAVEPLAALRSGVPGVRTDRDARREERRKQWQDWSLQKGTNGQANGVNFVTQILDGVSGIVESALGPFYSLLSPA